MSTAVAILIALLLGAGLASQVGINSSLRGALGHPLHATIVNFIVGIAALFAMAAAIGLRTPPGGAFARTSPWMYAGGLIGAVYVIGTVVLAPKLGAATLMVLIVTGQLVAALVIDHFGWLGFPIHPASWQRLLGVALLVAGVILVRRG